MMNRMDRYCQLEKESDPSFFATLVTNPLRATASGKAESTFHEGCNGVSGMCTRSYFDLNCKMQPVFTAMRLLVVFTVKYEPVNFSRRSGSF